ncbi:hypothetical protein HAPAU_35570 [Halalkalicoccus paucihalophilus]|uniref:Uncharacterized protein n=1 Tax=Halalkalicoccus paucihalophilus TaxID=1008153 RepID=A0A151AAF2_9EURY|nr:hypothetical protein HAPAU_35570 [Halalkalicoccus paucihalophilus]
MKHSDGQSNAVYSLPGGVTAYINILERMLLYIESNKSTYDELLEWFLPRSTFLEKHTSNATSR